MGLAKAQGGGSNLLERSVELQSVRALLEGAMSGAGQVLVLEGPAGIGKTAVLDEAIRLAGQSAVAAASAREMFGAGVWYRRLGARRL